MGKTFIWWEQDSWNPLVNVVSIPLVNYLSYCLQDSHSVRLVSTHRHAVESLAVTVISDGSRHF